MDDMKDALPIRTEITIESTKPKLSRTSTAKVRTGCVTCKKRHVKCDERKPHCGNCTRNNRQCEGYQTRQAKKRNASGPALLRWNSKQVSGAASPRIELRLVHDALDFRDARSVSYFDEFIQVVQGPWIAAGFNGHLWAVTLPQVARTNSVVRHAAIGIGALSAWYSQSRQTTLRTSQDFKSPTVQQDAHYQRALAHYCHALKLQSQQNSVQDAVFLSVLFLCFETLRGNRKAALDHMNHGLAMLLALLTDQESRLIRSVAPNPKPLLSAVGDIFTHLLPQARLILRGSLGGSPALPNFTKGLRETKQTVESFVILISQLASPPTSERMPAVLNSLDEFEYHWASGRNARLAIGPLILEIVHASGIATSDDAGDIAKVWQMITADDRIKEICESSSRELQELEAAFMPLFNRAIMADAGSPEYTRAIHLRLQYLGVYVFDNLTQFFDIEFIHAKTPLFREYLTLAEISLRSARRGLKTPAQQLSLQCSLAQQLFLLALFCRDPLLRDEATEILKDYPCQDGIWNAGSLYVLARRNRAVEQTNASEGTPLEQWHRLLRREYLFEEGCDRVVFCFLDRNVVTGEWQLVEETAAVEGDLDAVQWERRPLTASGKLLTVDVMTLWPDWKGEEEEEE
ncbi:hypothetical protein F66182_5316 [Fusarium sp. NRRL 66182]|nr:hypothetical protein F66182_5316 [Fusarium sp. NRRL 66182]